MSASPTLPLTVRRAGDADVAAIIALGVRSLGWAPGDATDRHFSWKHTENPFGRSPMWVAEIDGRLAGARTFLHWELRTGTGELRRAVRAVDTATDPDFQGRGVFTRLTLAALDALRTEGVDFVFNTPNSQSRPGYLKMGWEVVGRLPVVVRPTGLGALARIARARTPADRGAVPTSAGDPASAVLADRALVADLLAAGAAPTADLAPDALTTHRSPEYLAWRYGQSALHYRVVSASGGAAHGIGVFHLRRRGPATEAVVCELLIPGRDPRTVRAILRTIADTAEVDYLLALGTTAVGRRLGGFLPLPRTGPLLTARAVTRAPVTDPAAWRLTLGDVEVF